MNSVRYLGMDVHRDTISVAVLDEGAGLIMQLQFRWCKSGAEVCPVRPGSGQNVAQTPRNQLIDTPTMRKRTGNTVSINFSAAC